VTWVWAPKLGEVSEVLQELEASLHADAVKAGHANLKLAVFSVGYCPIVDGPSRIVRFYGLNSLMGSAICDDDVNFLADYSVRTRKIVRFVSPFAMCDAAEPATGSR
jgi:hypothetical protein